jgi:hypothetical protein
MTIESGLGITTLTVDDAAGQQRDIEPSVFNFQFATPRAVQDITAVSQNGMARLHLLADSSITFTGGFDDGANLAHAVFKDGPSGGVARELTFAHSGQTLFVSPLVLMLITDYSMVRGQDGSLVWTAPMVQSNGVVPAWS